MVPSLGTHRMLHIDCKYAINPSTIPCSPQILTVVGRIIRHMDVSQGKPRLPCQQSLTVSTDIPHHRCDQDANTFYSCAYKGSDTSHSSRCGVWLNVDNQHERLTLRCFQFSFGPGIPRVVGPDIEGSKFKGKRQNAVANVGIVDRNRCFPVVGVVPLYVATIGIATDPALQLKREYDPGDILTFQTLPGKSASGLVLLALTVLADTLRFQGVLTGQYVYKWWVFSLRQSLTVINERPAPQRKPGSG